MMQGAWVYLRLLVLLGLASIGMNALAQGMPNVPQAAPGTLLNGPIAPEMGRTTVIDYLGGYIVTLLVESGSEAGDDVQMRAWDLANPLAPVEVYNFGKTQHPFNGHGSMRRGNQLYIGGDPIVHPDDITAIEINESGHLFSTRWRGPFTSSSRGGMMAPWNAQGWWSYGEPTGNAYIELDRVRRAEWDHLGLTGVVGFPLFMGDLLIYASDQTLTGIATYDVADPDNPQLLDVLNTPREQGGIGGYWAEIYGHYVVFTRRSIDNDPDSFAGVQVVDFSNPKELRLHCSIEYSNPSSPGTPPDQVMYSNFQDEYIFADRAKIRINHDGCETELIYGYNPLVTMSQYSRAIGNLLLAGGLQAGTQPNNDGLSIWVHQSEPDNRAPFVSYHIPEHHQVNYPVDLPITVHIPETLRSETLVVTETPELGNTQTLTLLEVGGDPVRIDYVLSHTGLLTIDPILPLAADTTYEVRLTNGILDAAGNAMAEYSFQFSTGNTINGEPPANVVEPPVVTNVSVSSTENVPVGTPVSISVIATHNVNEPIEYLIERFDLSSGTWSTSSSDAFQFDTPGRYFIDVRARNSGGLSALTRIPVDVIEEIPTQPPGHHSSQLFCAQDSNIVWGVNPDNNTVFSTSVDGLDSVNEYTGVSDPRAIAMDNTGNLWVASFDGDRIDILDSAGGRIGQIDTGYGSAPFGVVLSPDGSTAYVSLYGSGELARIDTATLTETGRIELAPTAAALALSPDGNQLLVTRFISNQQWGEVWSIDTATWAIDRHIHLHKHLQNDEIDQGRGVPNYLASIIVNGTGTRAYVVGKKDNLDRGLLNGTGIDLDDDNTVRTIAMVIDLTTGQELRDQRIDFDNADSPSSLALSSDGSTLYIGLQGINQVFAFNVTDNGALTSKLGQIVVQRAPQGLCIDYSENRLLVKNFMARSLSAVDISGGVTNPPINTVSTVNSERLSVEVLAGKQIFYDAANGRTADGQASGKMSAEGYLSCATCHIDGGHDGNTYDFTGRGEGLRNNISLKGREGTRFGNAHWSANFDEIHDFENDIRTVFLGRGLMSDEDFAATRAPLGSPKQGLSTELDNLAAYVASLNEHSLPRSPFKTTGGALTQEALTGQAIFVQQGCTACHFGIGFTDGQVHNVGTLRSYSGQRSGDVLPGIKTPSLLSVFDTAPYLHDGSANTLTDVFSTVGGVVYQAEDYASTAEVVTQTGYSYLRHGQGVRLSTGESLQITNVDGASGGRAFVRLRYGSSAMASMGVIGVLPVGDSPANEVFISLEDQPLVDAQDVNFIESHAVEIMLQAGAENGVVIRVINGSPLVIDDITISHQGNIAQANVHTKITALADEERNALVAYLQQIDGSSVSGAPIAPDYTFNVTAGETIAIAFAQLLENASDPDGDALSVDDANNPQNGTLQIDVANEVITFIPAFNGAGIGRFEYTITDGLFTAAGSVLININSHSANTPPVAFNDTVHVGQAEVIRIPVATLLANDFDSNNTSNPQFDGDPLSIAFVDDPVNGSISYDATANEVVFTPNANFTDTAGFTYALSDGNDDGRYELMGFGVVILDVAEPINTAPSITIITPSNNITVIDGESVVFNASAIDTEDGELSGSVVWSSNRDGSLGSGATLLISTLSVGLHEITATVTDSGSEAAIATVSLTVERRPNTPPSITLFAPTSGGSFTQGDIIHFRASASDTEDGELSNTMSWRSNVDGPIGTGGSVNISSLSLGEHTITVSVADSESLTATTDVTIEVIAATPVALLDQGGDIGSVAVAGSSSYHGASDTYTVSGSGVDIEGLADSFYYAYTTVTDDIDVRVRIDSIANTSAWAKAGLMLRNSTSASAAYVAVLATPANGVLLQARTSDSGYGGDYNVASGYGAGDWLRLTRVGNLITAYVSHNGSDWVDIGSQTVTFSGENLVGLAVSATNNGVLNQSVFSGLE